MKIAFECGFAFLFLVLGAETYTHRTFSADPRYQAIVTCLAALLVTAGMLPLLLHLLPRVGRIALVSWLSILAILIVLGIATRP